MSGKDIANKINKNKVAMIKCPKYKHHCNI